MITTREGFEIFTKREKPIASNISIIPKDYLEFLQAYKLNKETFKRKKVLHNGNVINLSGFKFIVKIADSVSTYINYIDKLFDFSSIKKELINYKNNLESWHNLDFIHIGNTEMSDIILLGLGESNFGQVWKYGDYITEDHLIKLSDTFIQFIEYQEEFIMYEDIELTIKENDRLYKNNNENFWRIKAH